MRAAFFALALLPAAALGELGSFNVCETPVSHLSMTFIATISINTPSSTGYWFVTSSVHCVASLTSLFLLFRIQFDSNNISWSYTSGDPTPVDILVTNGDNATLNGDFSIARYVPVSQQVCFARYLYIRRLM